MAINWLKGTWEPGDKVKYHTGHGHKPVHLEIVPGLYWYAGFGTGDLFLADGTILRHVSPSEALQAAKERGLKYWYVDSFITSSFSSVMG